MHLVALGLVLYLVSAAAVWSRGVGEFNSRADKLFDKALETYRQQQYKKARNLFEKVLDLSRNQRSSAAHLMLSRTLIKLGKYKEGMETARQLERHFPQSRYIGDARLVAGDGYYLLRRYYEAAQQYGRILATPMSLALQARAAERLAGIVENAQISEQAIDRIRLQVGERRMREALLFGAARWYQRLGWVAQSRAVMRQYLDEIPEGIFAGLARRSLQGAPGEAAAEVRPSGPKGRLPRLGVLLPLSGPQSAIGQDLLAGIEMANAEWGNPFEIETADLGADYGELPILEGPGSELVRTVHAARRLIEREKVLALVGPVFSSTSVVAAAVAEAAGVPMIAPLAQQSGLDALGQYIFQLNIIPEVQARALGEYATLVLGLKTLAILAPLSDYGWNFALQFARTVQANGAEVVYRDWYVSGETKHFQSQFEAMRRVGFELMPPPPDSLALFDSLATVVLDASPESDSLFLQMLESEGEEEETPPDSADIFIDTIGGVAIVVESFEDAQTIVPQLHFHRLQTQILGNDLWYDPEAIRQMRPLEREDLKGAIFVSGRNDKTVAARHFIDAFRRRFQRDPGLAAHGYDAARLVLEAWTQGRRTRAQLREWLAGVRDFAGASGRISFSPERRANGEVLLMKIDRRGRIRPLSRTDLPDWSRVGEELPAAELQEGEWPQPSIAPRAEKDPQKEG